MTDRGLLCRGLRAGLCHGWAILVMAGVLGIAGCGGGVLPDANPTDYVDGNVDRSVTSPLGKTYGEPNGSFAGSIVVVFDSGGVAELQGTVALVGDMDVFRLGALAPGDRVVVVAETEDSDLDVSVAIFDADQRIVFANDDRVSGPAVDLDSYVDWIVRHESDPYYLVITHSAFARTTQYTGTYTVRVEVTSGGDVPAAVGQILLLDYRGGYVGSPALGPVTLAPFDAADISPIYQGQTTELKEEIRAVMEQNFEGFDVTITTSDDPLPADGVQYSTIYFGGYSPGAFGLAEAIDPYNIDYCDDAIVYTESFGPSVFSVTPTIEELGAAIGNVAAHEAAHLLGLNHVDDDRALMDDRSASDVLFMDQEFMEAPLSNDVMPIGVQDAVLLLMETVGLGVF